MPRYILPSGGECSRRVLSAASASLLLAACGSATTSGGATGASTGAAGTSAGGGSATTPGSTGNLTGGQHPTLNVTVTVSGAVNGSAQYSEVRNGVDTCQHLGQYGTVYDATSPAPADSRVFNLPTGDQKATIAGHVFTVGYSIAHYHGPATYTDSDLNIKQQPGDGMTVDSLSEGNPFQPDAQAVDQATVAADGSGTYSFSNWTDPSSRTESGTVSWTCSG